ANRNETQDFMTRGQKKLATERISNAEITELLDGYQDHADSFLEGEQALDRHRTHVLQQAANLQFFVLVIGGFLAVAGSTILLFIFGRQVGHRLTTLTENTRRIAEGKDLMPRMIGNDELVRLDSFFHDMAASLRHKDQEN